MAWPNVVVGQDITAQVYNDIVSAVKVWQGDVSANANSLVDTAAVAFRTANASWQEFRWQSVLGVSQSGDLLKLQVNARIGAGGSDSWLDLFVVAAVTGSLLFPVPIKASDSLTFISGATAGWLQMTSTNAATWQQVRSLILPGGSAATDQFYCQFNSRSTSGGADAWATMQVINLQTGAINWNTANNWLAAATFFAAASFNLSAYFPAGSTAFFSGPSIAFISQRLYAGGGGFLYLDSAASAGAWVASLSVSGAGGLTIAQPQLLNFGSNWQTFTPTFSASGSMTVSSPTVNEALYLRIGPVTYFKMLFTLTLGGTASGSVTVGIPTSAGTMMGQISSVSCFVNYGSWLAAFGYVNPTLQGIVVSPNSQTNFPRASVGFMISGFFRTV